METDAEMQDEKHMALHTEERLNMIGFGDIVKVRYDMPNVASRLLEI